MTDVPQVMNHLIYKLSSSSQRLTFLLLTKEHLNVRKQTPLCYDTAEYNANTDFVEVAPQLCRAIGKVRHSES